MYIAIREIKKHPFRSFLILCLISLIAALVLLLSGLSEGLSKGMNGAIINVRGNLIVMDEEAEGNISRSLLPFEIAEGLHYMPATDEAAPLGHRPTVVYTSDHQANVALFGYTPDTIGAPSDLNRGRLLKEGDQNKAVVDRSFLETFDLDLGDSFRIQEQSSLIEIVGVTGDNRFSMQPTMFMSLDEWQSFQPDDIKDLVTMIVVQGPRELTDEQAKEGMEHILLDGLHVDTRMGVAMGIPGVSEMYLVPELLKWMSYGVVGVICFVFFYIQLIHRRSQFIVLKALGADQYDLFKIVLSQILLLVLGGMIVGFSISYVGHLMMPPSLSVQMPMETVLASGLLFVLASFSTLPLFLIYLKNLPSDPDRTL
ncbi:ABC transporter permease [Salipaludibacillus daqingensis]|uniref:ABC transporter permease n=1 Tax=Salipaludibacillus daqingensis TaxID=3041001 RepID=UPI002476AF5F|nr:ABC transporter permease [Salipaludibacillus daqingensis]